MHMGIGYIRRRHVASHFCSLFSTHTNILIPWYIPPSMIGPPTIKDRYCGENEAETDLTDCYHIFVGSGNEYINPKIE